MERLLHNQIDHLMWRFRATTPNFYDKYRTARVIAGPSKPAPEAEPAEKSKVTAAAKTTKASEVKTSVAAEAKLDAAAKTTSNSPAETKAA